MGKSVLRHPGRDRAETLLREGKLRRYQIADECGASLEAIRQWARAIGIDRIKGTEPTRKKGA